MKLTTFIFFVLLLFSLTVFSQTKKVKDIERLTQQWLDVNNNQDMDKLSALYAQSINFYGKNKDKATCINEKKEFFQKYPRYSISISNLDIDFYKSGICKSNFVKTEVWDDKTRSPQQAYLLFERDGSSYHIIAESDNRMDAQRGYVQQLGDKVVKSSNLTYMLLGAGILVVILSVIYLINKNKEHKKKIASSPMLYNQESSSEVIVKLPEIPAEELIKNKGLAFEQYVVKHFDKNYFKLIHWRGDKYIDGHYPLSSMDPDLDYCYQDSARRQCFAIECKWRQGFSANNTITLAEERQLANYRKYQDSKKFPVFIVLGVGGTGQAPNIIYIIPLNDITSPVISRQSLEKYTRQRTDNFYLRMPAMILE